jgi:hypothetical protein
MRERVEDLGRISVLLKNILDGELLDETNRPWRPKDSLEWFETMDKEKQQDFIHNTAYRIQELEQDLYEILSIAEGTDFLNE